VKTINAFEAKTHLSRLLRDVEQYNQEIVIKRHNHCIACLVPYSSHLSEETSALDIISGLRSIRKDQPVNSASVTKFIADGRKR
jgi:antitoxin (DNA-binding transcriptional repressor) of toxin-antitoxin stability system